MTSKKCVCSWIIFIFTIISGFCFGFSLLSVIKNGIAHSSSYTLICNITSIDTKDYYETSKCKSICFECNKYNYKTCFYNVTCPLLHVGSEYSLSRCIDIKYNIGYIDTIATWKPKQDYEYWTDTEFICKEILIYGQCVIYFLVTLFGIIFLGCVVAILKSCCLASTHCGHGFCHEFYETLTASQNPNYDTMFKYSTGNSTTNVSSFTQSTPYTPSTPQFSMTQSLNRETSPYTGENRYYTSYAWERN